MNELKEINIKQLFELPENEFKEYQSILSNLKPKPFFRNFKATELMDLSFTEVTEILSSSKDVQGLINMFCVIFNINQEQFFNGKVTDFFYSFNWIQEQIKTITELQKSAFPIDYDDESENWKQANNGRLDKFGTLNITSMLGEKYNKLPSEIDALPFHEVFAMQYQVKEMGIVQKEFNRLMTKKNDI